jgi:hypothetical protein
VSMMLTVGIFFPGANMAYEQKLIAGLMHIKLPCKTCKGLVWVRKPGKGIPDHPLCDDCFGEDFECQHHPERCDEPKSEQQYNG